MERDYITAMSRLSVDALALILFAQSQRGAPNAEPERRFDGNGHERYTPNSAPVLGYRGSRAKYHVRQPGGKNGLK